MRIIIALMFMGLWVWTLLTVEKYTRIGEQFECAIAHSNEIPEEFRTEEFAKWLWEPTEKTQK